MENSKFFSALATGLTAERANTDARTSKLIIKFYNNYPGRRNRVTGVISADIINSSKKLL